MGQNGWVRIDGSKWMGENERFGMNRSELMSPNE